MDEHLERDLGVQLVRNLDDFEQLVASEVLVLLVSIDDVHQRSAVLQVLGICRVGLSELLVAWKVLDVELDVWVVRNACEREV